MRRGHESTKKKFLIVAGYSASLANFRGHLIKSLCDKGVEVHAAAPMLTADLDTVSVLQAWGVKVHDIPFQRAGLNPLSDAFSMFCLYRLLRDVKPESFFGYTAKPVIYGLLAAWLVHVPNRFALITGLGYAFTGSLGVKRRLVQKILRALYRVSLRRAKTVFFQNPDDQILFRELSLLSPESFSVVVNGSGVDTSYFGDSEAPSGAPSFLLIARLLGDKGVREYVAAASQVRKVYPDVTFRLVGGLDENPDSITSAELDRWTRSGDVEYIGHLADVRPAIATSAVYVLPSYREGAPRTVLEAMAMGRPIITTDAPGCRETVIDGVNGYLVPVKSASALRRAMEAFINDPASVARMGKQSRRIAEEKYDVRKVNKVMLREMGIS